MRQKLHYDWHWQFVTGNGDLGNQGIHQMDIARWFLKQDALSPRVFSVGGRLSYVDDATTPNTQIVYHDYPKAPLIFEVRGLKTSDYRGAKIGVIITCENGQMVIPSYTSAIAYDKEGKEIKKWSGGGNHYENFIAGVRSRKKEVLKGDILEGHLSSALCHTGNISYQLGKPADPEVIRETIKGSKDLAESYGRFEEHLGQNQVDLKATQATLGVFLTMNPKKERFVGNEAANAMLTRPYRAPYVVPEKV
jgi:predicted dehydrogenase